MGLALAGLRGPTAEEIEQLILELSITAECDYYWLCRGLAVASFADLFLLPHYRKVLRL